MTHTQTTGAHDPKKIEKELGHQIFRSLNPIFKKLSTACRSCLINQQAIEDKKLLDYQYELLQKANIDSVILLSQTIEAKDHYTQGHCLRVRHYSRELALALKLDDQELRWIEFGAILHDIGKIGVPVHILNKFEKLCFNSTSC